MSVSTIAQMQQVIQNLSQLNTQGNTLETEISTGLKSQTYSGIAPQAAQLVNLNSVATQQQGFINTINIVNQQLGSMSLVTSNIATSVEQFASQLQTNAFNTTGATIQTQAQSLLAQIGDYLNTQGGEGYLFGGSDTTQAPFDAAGLPSPGDLTTPVNGAPPAGYYQGNDSIASAQIDNNLNVQYGVTADNSGFEQAIRVLNFLANSPPLDPTNATDVANVNTAQQMLSSAGTALQQLTSTIGLNQSELNTELTMHQQAQTMAQSNIGDITQADPATVITQLDTLQTQLEASYQSINMLQNLSLANYLK
ncbi:MAG TPA: flagellin [Stellaceae bacterium]|nr:flagellin [Stellaceae bacterium]